MSATRNRSEIASRRRRWILINLALTVVLAGAVGTAGWFGYRTVRNVMSDNTRAEVVDAAGEAVRAIFKVSPSTIDADLARGEELTTGDLLDEWIAKEDQVRESVRSQSANRTSEVIKAAWASGDSDSATVLLAVDTVTSWDAPPVRPDDGTDDQESDDEASGTIPDPVTDHYRVTAGMSLVNGTWLLSNLELG